MGGRVQSQVLQSDYTIAVQSSIDLPKVCNFEGLPKLLIWFVSIQAAPCSVLF